MISFRDLAIRRGGRELLSGLDVTLHAGWRVGVVGRNGCGKSSLFAVVTGQVEPDRGAMDMPRASRLACVAQETPPLPDPALDFVLGGDAEAAAALRDAAEAEAREDYEAQAAAHHRIEELNAYDARARAARLLFGLGFKSDTHEQPVAEFSGGWRVRLNVARALMAPSDVLLLDEPTNHLDLDAVLWLEDWIRRYTGTVLVISHDRDFLDGVATHVLHLAEGRGKLYTGNYQAFERQRAEQMRQQQIAFEKEQAERAHLQSFIDRFRAKASKARQAQSRIKRLEKMAGTEAVRMERSFKCSFPTPVKLPDSLIKLDELDAGYGERRVLGNIRLGLEAGDRVGLLGPNGEGKSTLVKTIAGALAPLSGTRVAHKDLVVGYFAQHTVEQLHDDQTPLQHLVDIAKGVSTQDLRDYLGRWNFLGDRVFETIEGFSGGERARLALALVAWRKPNLLLLDEPTNHLDLDMREALADALNDFVGALVLVSHDRSLLSLTCDTFWRVADAEVVPFDGDLDDYAGWLRARRKNENSREAPAVPRVSAADKRRASAQQRERDRAQQKQLKQCESRIESMQREKAEIAAKLADPAYYAAADMREFKRLSARNGELVAEIEKLEAQWLSLYEAVSAAADSGS